MLLTGSGLGMGSATGFGMGAAATEAADANMARTWKAFMLSVVKRDSAER